MTSSGEGLLFGRTHDFGNTLRVLNMNRSIKWLAKAVNFVSDAVWRTDLSPVLLEPADGVELPQLGAVTCSPGALTAFLSGTALCRGCVTWSRWAVVAWLSWCGCFCVAFCVVTWRGCFWCGRFGVAV